MIHLSPTAVLDDYQIEVITACDPIIGNHVMRVTRGHSSPLDQLKLIKEYSLLEGCTYPELYSEPWNTKMQLIDGMMVYPWQRSWSSLLNKYYKTGGKQGRKINPPLAAICLFDYDNGHGNMKGQLISASPHIIAIDEDPRVKPCPIDWSMKVNGVPDEHIAHSLLDSCMRSIPSIRHLTIEPANGCIHMDLNLRR